MRNAGTGGKSLSVVALAVAVFALLVSIVTYGQLGERRGEHVKEQLPGILSKIDSSRELHAGYGVYPPYSMEAKTKSGIRRSVPLSAKYN